jgi:aminopeptidase
MSESLQSVGAIRQVERYEPDPAFVKELADLAFGPAGAHVQRQRAQITGAPELEEHMDVIGRALYEKGAELVEVVYDSPYLKRARALSSPAEYLKAISNWPGYRMLELVRKKGVLIQFASGPGPEMEDVDPRVFGQIRNPVDRVRKRIGGDLHWTGIPFPRERWARLVHPDIAKESPAAAHQLLAEQISRILRLDEPDPTQAWLDRFDELDETAEWLTDQRFDSLRFTSESTGTDLTVGLLPSSTWIGPRDEVNGIVHGPNLPTEEVFTTPDHTRIDGTVYFTQPVMVSGMLPVRDAALKFEKGKIVDVSGDRNADALRRIIKTDRGAARVGEIALVDDAGRVRREKTTFYLPLLDENAASHLALGQGFGFALGAREDVKRMNRSKIHMDCTFGTSDMVVTGITRDGLHVPILAGGKWQK